MTKATRACIVREALQDGHGVEVKKLRAAGDLKYLFRGAVNG